MLAEPQDEIPVGEGWVYEPKWDGFRALPFLDGEKVHLCSRNGQPLERYFPEIVELLAKQLPPCILDGELFIPTLKGLDFEKGGALPLEVKVFFSYFAVSAGILAWTLLSNSVSHVRRFITLVADFGTVTFTMWYFEERALALFLVYVWVTLANGFEERNSPWAHARRRYDAGVGLRSLDDVEALIAFFEVALFTRS